MTYRTYLHRWRMKHGKKKVPITKDEYKIVTKHTIWLRKALDTPHGARIHFTRLDVILPQAILRLLLDKLYVD